MVNDQAYILNNLVMYQAMTLDEKLACILQQNGGKNNLSSSIKIEDVHSYRGMSGYNYWENDDLIAQLYIGTLLSGTYVIYKKTFMDDKLVEVYDYFDQEGKFFYQSSSLDGQCMTYSSIAMDTSNPFVNHIYNILHVEYLGTTFNYGNTQRIKYLETILNSFYDDENIFITVNDGFKDSALKNINKEILKIERDDVLKWSERQKIFKQLKEVRNKVLSTKRRVHGFQFMFYDFIVFIADIKVNIQAFKQRPINNFLGALYKYTLGNVFWFAGTVRSNLGYSVALAIYGPFTFYFITQPMNPHAMWAVGKVRNAYIKVSKALDGPVKNPNSLIADDTTSNSQGVVEDKVSTSQASSSVPMAAARAPKISWDDRMSNFKAMQIAYEESMVFSERIGRIEQFETQFNFPLTAEAAWMEMELYLNDIKTTLDFNTDLDARYLAFLKNEEQRTIELQFYIWQKMGQFFIDHPYIVVDQDNEQPERNYYVGRQFVFFKTMTEKLTNLGLADSPVTHKNIEMLAKKFSDLRIEGDNVIDNLKKNSKLFNQKNLFSSDEHREYMKRQWEIIFMQQNKKQEASSFALQAYTWSIRNAVWLLQTVYSAKRSELGAMTYKYNLNNLGTSSVTASHTMNQYLENMFHNLTMEYVSIKKEMARNLKNDNEAHLRENVVNNVKNYLLERDKLFNSGVFAKNASN